MKNTKKRENVGQEKWFVPVKLVTKEELLKKYPYKYTPVCGDDPKDVPPNCVPYTPNQAYYESGCKEPILLPFVLMILAAGFFALFIWWAFS